MTTKIEKKRKNYTAFSNLTIDKFSKYREIGLNNNEIAKELNITLTMLLSWIDINRLYVYWESDKINFENVWKTDYVGLLGK